MKQETTKQKTSAKLHDSDTNQVYDLMLPIPGSFNLENAMCAIACARAVGVEINLAITALQSFKNAAGRMEQVDAGQDFSVFIDFTVTPQAFEKTLKTLSSMQ